MLTEVTEFEQLYEDLYNALYSLKYAELLDKPYGDRLIMVDRIKTIKAEIHKKSGSGLETLTNRIGEKRNG